MLKYIILFLLSINSCFAGFSGTGFFIDNKGDLVTCEHVIRGTSHHYVFLNNVRYPVTVLYSSRSKDVAILHVNLNTPYFLTVSSYYSGGDSVTMYGFPRPDDFGMSLKVSIGTVSYNRYDPYSTMNTEIQSYPGYSGAPLIDDCGKVLGIDEAGLGKHSSITGWAVPGQRITSVIGESRDTECRPVSLEYAKKAIILVYSE